MSPSPLILALAAALAIPSAAAAQPLPGSPAGGWTQVGTRLPGAPGDHRRPRRDQVLLYGYGSPEGWAYFNNRSFAPDSYNDWWHDRPDRSYPRWMSNNEGCQRRWWSGGGWRC